MNRILFKLVMRGTVSLYNDLLGTKVEYNPKTNKIKVSNKLLVANELLRQQMLSEAIVTYNSLLPAGGEQ